MPHAMRPVLDDDEDMNGKLVTPWQSSIALLCKVQLEDKRPERSRAACVEPSIIMQMGALARTQVRLPRTSSGMSGSEGM